MSKTKINGNWPGKPLKADPSRVQLVEETYVAPDRHANVRGKSKYAEIIASLVNAPPGTRAAFCPTRKEGRALVHAIVRYLEQNGLDKKLRAAAKSEGEAAKVWVLKRDA